MVAGFAAAAKPADTRNYDCTKAGNANKAACKGAAPAATTSMAAAKPAAAPAKTADTRNYDCTKAGNANKAACKGAAPAATTSMAAAKPAATASMSKAAATKPAAASAVTAANATAQCKDGTYSQSTTHSGTCSRHGGVAKWMDGK